MALGTDRNRTGVAGIKFCEKEETDKKLPLGAVFYLLKFIFTPGELVFINS